MRLQDKIAVVTGAGGYIGSAIAVRLAEEGAKVIVNDMSSDKAEKTVKEISNTGGKAIVIQADVTDRGEVGSMMDRTVEIFGRVNILVNVAGGPRNNLLTDLSEEDWDYTINLNLKGSFNCIQAAAKYMMKQKHGKIVNTSSTAKNGVPWFSHIGQSNYSSAKAALTGLTRSLAQELAPYSINVNCVIPGPVETPKSRELFRQLEKDPQVRVSPLRLIPLRRLGKPADVANAVLFLASEEASYITGSLLYVSGGLWGG